MQKEEKMNFENFALHTKIYDGVQAMGYDEPTPIQSQSIPPIMEGRDVMGLAQTGTGKTAAFVLPVLQRLMEGPRGRLRALIIAPTRELTEQINKNITQLAKKTKLTSTTVYGGVSIHNQINRLRGKVDVVAACPGRLLDHIERGTINVSAIEILVLDEADHMFDMGFLPDIRKILGHLPRRRQNLLFAATMPGEIAALAGEMLNNPVRVQIGQIEPVKSVTHTCYAVEQMRKTSLLKDILSKTEIESVLVFTKTKRDAESLASQLERGGHNAVALHGNMLQKERQRALNHFREGQVKILVATDIAARGIDVTRVSHVINYDMPDTMDAYTHRIGRTGRASRTGDAYNFVTIKDIAILSSLKRVLGSALKYEGEDAAGFLWADPAKTAKSGYSRNTVKRSFSPRRGGFGKSRSGSARSLDGFPGLKRIAAVSTRT
ncbi:MAG TPA: DEAD/DEAH box helicase [Syntrophales bacterium]|nr:DEAD/DEAH box helicase [Syntrophales bacterium]HQI24655.1 DEAD/DEAH box helicase [Smithella sp.]